MAKSLALGINPLVFSVISDSCQVGLVVRRSWKVKAMTAAVASALGARSCGGFSRVAFKYKKGEWCNRMNSLNRKRQILTVMRQDGTVHRQKSLALLSVWCQSADC
jgi:hypothetical protein